MRLRPVLGGLALSLVLAGGATAASAEPGPYTTTPPAPEARPTTVANPVDLADPGEPAPQVAGAVVSPAGGPGPTVAAGRTPSGSLPVTGGDVAGLVAIGTAALGAGGLLVLAGRRRAAGSHPA